ncbi:MAG: hypothetical protein CVT67_00095 [Actinobacteria bacterium HGW-Actinobacteria-7]|jgi:membrane protease YdiL (CAAX protease family)|nr:MAG: hypothetical protein CVT67_00095 [Actinobacteria bacterium HGW-Actinobacteria-7]
MNDARGETTEHANSTVAWGRVALFYGIALGMVSLLGVAFALSGADFFFGRSSTFLQLVVAFLYMPMPLVAGLIVERVAGRRPEIRRIWAEFKPNWRRILLVTVAAASAIYLLEMGLTALLGNLLGVKGVGHLVFTQKGLIEVLTTLLPAQVADGLTTSSMPAVLALYPLGLVAGIGAGLTINGLFAFGEEYGWRGVLMDELAPLGAVKANLLTGVMWGLWHAPLILLGFNYGADRILGAFMMCLWVTPLSFLLWRARQYSGSIVAPAMIHGAFNGSAGFFMLLIAAKTQLVGAPVGLVGALGTFIAAVLVWWLTARAVSTRAQQPTESN